jgi:hypothetical protein
MASIKISSLPLKRVLAPEDIFTLVDTQFGPNSYVSKRTTLADLLTFMRNSIGVTTQFVLSVNGQTGVITLFLRTLDDTTIVNPANLDVLLYDAATQKWVNSAVIDCGVLTPEVSPFTAMPMMSLAVKHAVNTPTMSVAEGTSVVYSVNGKIGQVMLGVSDMTDAAISASVVDGQILTYAGDETSQRWENRTYIDGGKLELTLSVLDTNYVESVNGKVGYVLIGLKDLGDVSLNDSAKDDILTYSYIDADWKNSDVIDGGVLSPANSLAMLTEANAPIMTETLLDILV